MSSKYGFLSFLVLGAVLLLIFENYELWDPTDQIRA